MPSHASTILHHLRRLASPSTSDAALLARWMEQRDEAAFADLVACHGPMVLGVCRRILGDVQHAEDAFQATFLVLARKAARVRRPEALASFLYGVALRLARKSRGALRRHTLPSLPSASEPVDPHPHPLDVLSGRELLALLDEEVARLPESYRWPLLLCVLQGRSVEEAARMLGWSTGSVRGRLARGRERLKQRLTRRGLGLSAGAVALLVPVAVPERLQAECVRNLTAPASASAAANALVGSASVLKPKTVCLGLFILATVGLGAGLSLIRAPEAATPNAAAPAAPPAQAKDEPRLDRYGDPLPTGAIARLGTMRFRARSEVQSLAFAPDGKSVAVASYGGYMLMDATSGKRLRQLAMPDGGMDREPIIAFSPDSKRLAGRGNKLDGRQYKGVVRIWDLAGQGKPREYDVERTMWVGWSAEGEPLAISLEKDGLRLRELASGRSRRFECKNLRKAELYSYVACVCAPGGKTLAIVDEQSCVHIWDTVTGRQRCTLPFKNVYIRAIALSPDGRLLASLVRDQPEHRYSVRIWDAFTGKILHTVATDQKDLETIVFTPDSKTLATAAWSDVRFWDAATGREQGRTRDKSNFPPCLGFSPDGKTLVAAERHGSSIHLWDVATGQRKPEAAGHRCQPHGIAFAPDGWRVATGGGLDGTIHIWDLNSGESLTRIQRPVRWVRDIAFSPDGRSLFSTWDDDQLWISGAVSGGRLHVLKLEDPDRPDTHQSAISMHPSSDGKTLIALSYYYGRKNNGMSNMTLITGWDTSTRKQLFRRRRPGMDSWVALSADARVLAVPHPQPDREMGPGRGSMHLEDVATGEVLLTFPALEGQTWPLAFSPDDRLLASNNFNWKLKNKKGYPAAVTGNTLHLWETATASEVLALPMGHQNRTAFSPDGRLLAVTVPAREILLWDLAHDRELRRFKGFDAEVTHLAFSPDGRRLISGLEDSTLLVWDVGPRGKSPSKLDTDGATKAWTDLAGTDAARAFRARWALATAPGETIPLLKKYLRSVKSAEPQRLRQLLADLESDEFAVREKAQSALEKIGDLAEPALKKTLASKPTLEVRRRVQAILERLRGPVTRPDLLRSLRAVAVLEDIASPGARKLLEELSEGAPEARLTREAKASLKRLNRRTRSGG